MSAPSWTRPGWRPRTSPATPSGGWVALELARRGRARSVVAFSPAGAWELPRDLNRLLRLFRLANALAGRPLMRRLAARPRLRRILLKAAFEHADRIPNGEVTELFADVASCTLLEGLLDAARDGGPIARFERLDCPVRIAWARTDRTIPYPRYGKPLRAAVPGAEFVALDGVGHVPMYDDPQLVARTILEVTTTTTTTTTADGAVRLVLPPAPERTMLS